MAILDVDQHRRMFTEAGFVDVTIDEDAARGWICVTGTKPPRVPHGLHRPADAGDVSVQRSVDSPPSDS